MDKGNYFFIKNLISRRIYLTQLFAGMLFIFYVLGDDAWAERNILFEESLYLLGALLVGVGVIGRAWCFSYISGNKNIKLITSGPYSMCRNPLYLFGLIASLGAGFCTETITIPLTILLAFSIYYPFQIRREEKELLRRHGEDYEGYCRQVPSLLPSFSSFKEEEVAMVAPRAFRRGIMDLVFYITMIGVLDYVETLHKINWLITYYKIY